ncbi:MAG: CoA-binding protein [Bacteroidota bacterium]
MPIENDGAVREILKAAKTIAVVGASPKPWRDSNSIAQFLMTKGYTVYPVNPNYPKVLEMPCYPDLKSVPGAIDIVDVFRSPDAVMEIVEQAIAVHAPTLWLQLGVVNEEAALKAESAGISVIMDHCIAVDHRRLIS